MGKKTENRKKRCNDMLSELQRITQLKGVDLKVLNRYPMHLRLVADVTVDYWPSTSRAWIFGSPHASAEKVEPWKAVEMTIIPRLSVSTILNAVQSPKEKPR